MTVASAAQVAPGLGWPETSRPGNRSGLGWPDCAPATPQAAARDLGRTRTIVVANQKGGVGKTTTAVNVAAALAARGARVLLLDLDPQGNASTALAIPHPAGAPSVYDVLLGDQPLAEVVQPCREVAGLFGVPATLDLAGAEVELVGVPAREFRLRRALDGATSGYDFVLIDCPPSLGFLTLNALVAAEELLVPVQCEYYALEGLGHLVNTVDLVKTSLNPALRLSAIVLTMYDGRTRLASGVAAEVRRHFGATVLATTVPRSVRISEAPSYGQTVISYDPTSPGALCYREIARELSAAEGDGA